MEAQVATRRVKRHDESGYVLLALLLLIALIVVAAAVAAPKIAFSIQRDREQELIHRGVQYTRAIRAFSRKFGRYPSTIEELQSTNGQRFLRKRYKDPITGKDFKLLHLADVQLSGGPGVAAYTQGSLQAMQGNGNSSAGTPSAPPQGSTGQNANAAADAGAAADGVSQDAAPSASEKPDTLSPVNAAGDSIGTSNFGAGPIVGVASASKQRTIREFGKKNHYNDWQFYYDPGYDRGFTINGPTVRMALPNASPLQGQASGSGLQQSAQPERQGQDASHD